MVFLTQVARKTSNHTHNYSHLGKVRDKKIDFEALLKQSFHKGFFKTVFREYQH
jgi:maltoporin